MREKARIHRICKKLEKLWNRFPDQRLGQLLSNYVVDETYLFYQEDYETEELIDKLI